MSDPLKIETLTAFIATDKEGNEGICAFGSLGVGVAMMPMVCTDQERMEQFRLIAQKLAKASGIRIVIASFSVRTDIEEIDP